MSVFGDRFRAPVPRVSGGEAMERQARRRLPACVKLSVRRCVGRPHQPEDHNLNNLIAEISSMSI